MWIIFLIIFLIFIFSPVWRFWRAIMRARRQMRDLDDAFRRAGFQNPYGSPEEREQQRRREQTSRRGGWSTPPKKRKKIDKETGEYVKFTEVKVSETEQTAATDAESGASAKFRVEEQVTDVTWEDL